MVFTVKVFEVSRCQKEYKAATAGLIADEKAPNSKLQQNVKQLEVSSFSKKRKSENDGENCEGCNKPRSSPISVKQALSKTKFASILPQPLIKKKIITYAPTHCFALKGTICSSIGLRTTCTITLKASMQSAKSWRVNFSTASTYG